MSAAQTHRDGVVSALRRMLERFETGALQPNVRADLRQRYADDAAAVREALQYLGADEVLAKAQAAKRTIDPTANALIEAMLPQLLIVLVQRLGGEVVVPVDEIDTVPARFNMGMVAGPRLFRFVNVRKA